MNIETSSRKIIARLELEGWVQVSVRGSHRKFRRGERTVVVPHPKKDMPLKTARSIAKAAGWV